jgi:PAS domain S-box-containing protein
MRINLEIFFSVCATKLRAWTKLKEHMNNNVDFKTSDLNLLPTPIGLADAQGVLAFSNAAFDEYFGFNTGVVSNTFADRLAEASREPFLAALRDISGGAAEREIVVLSEAMPERRLGLTLTRNPAPIMGCDCLLSVRPVDRVDAASEGSKADLLFSRLTAVMDNLPEAVWLKNTDGRYVLVNKQFANLYGMTPSQMLGKVAADLLPAAEAATVETEDQRAVDSAEPTVYESQLVVGGVSRHYEVTKVAVRGADGKLAGVLGYAVDITSQKEREQTLAAAIREQQLVFEHTSVGIVFIREGVIARVNDAFGQIFGYASDELRGASIAALPMFAQEWPQWAPSAPVNDATGVRSSPTIVTERLLRCRDNRPVTCSIYARALSDDDQSQGMVYALIDVTAQRESERRLDETKALLDAVIEHLPSVVSVRDALTGRYVHFSRSAEKMVGRQREDVLGHTPFEVYPPADADEVESVARLVIQTGQRFSTTTSIVNQLTGKTGVAQRTTIPISDESGRVRYVMNLGEDITEKISADRALRESEARFRQFASNVDQALFWSDPERSSWHFQNSVFEEIWGLSRQALAMEPSLPIAAIVEPDRDTFRQAQQLERTLQRVDVEFRVQNPKRGIRWVRMRTVSSRAEGGAIRVFGTMDDITERKQLEEERIERLVQQREKLVKEVHHRIKNNLQGVVGLMQHSARTKPGLAAELNEVASQISAIAQVHGLQMANAAAIGVVDLVKAVVLALSRAIGYEFRTEIAEGLEDWALQESEGVACALVINELAANAVAHGKGECGLRLFAQGDEVLVIEVWNTGALPESFEPAGAKTKASGLGLIRALVPRKGGQLEFGERDGNVVAMFALSPPAIYRHTGVDDDWE